MAPVFETGRTSSADRGGGGPCGFRAAVVVVGAPKIVHPVLVENGSGARADGAPEGSP
jgi:hypothetical protein